MHGAHVMHNSYPCLISLTVLTLSFDVCERLQLARKDVADRLKETSEEIDQAGSEGDEDFKKTLRVWLICLRSSNDSILQVRRAQQLWTIC